MIIIINYDECAKIWIWLFDDGKNSWIESVGKLLWELISGQWDKFLNED